MANDYNRTMATCFSSYVVQAIVNNFVPMLFVTFQATYGIPLEQITLLITLNFVVQLLVDLLSAGFVDKIGYRVALVAANLMAAAGLVLLAVLPGALPSPFVGILACVMIYAVGGGLIEVLVSPVVEACPSDNKETAMSLLHSFYCWGAVAVVLVSTAFFALFGTGSWRVLAVLWAILPLYNAFMFTRVPIASLIAEGEQGMSIPELVRSRMFWLLMMLMVCAGASELSISQWASTFAEQGLGVSKTVGDLAGPMMFAVLMGTSRTIFATFGEKIDTNRYILGSALLCVASYLGIALSPVPQLSLVFCALSGFSVGIMWPGTFSKATAYLPRGGTALFALLALGGDIGCSAGPTLVGLVSSACGDNLSLGILVGIVFPVAFLACAVLLTRSRRERVRS